jgi:hypothetical protein
VSGGAQNACLLDYLSLPSRLTQNYDIHAQEGDKGFLHILSFTHLDNVFTVATGA